MEFRVLGPVEVLDDEGSSIKLGAGKQRALLANLLLSPNRAVPVERLIDDLWGEEVPPSAQKSVQIYVSRLRKQLGADLIRTRGPGYLIQVDPSWVDVFHFEQLAAEGRQALAGGDPETAARRLREALELWRGPALAEFVEPFAAAEGPRLEEERLACLEERIEADLAVGRHAELISELDSLVKRHPLRERLRALLMVALYRAGRQADALGAYHDLRRRLDDELGIEPSQRLRDLERRILLQDDALEAPARLGGPAAAEAKGEEHGQGAETRAPATPAPDRSSRPGELPVPREAERRELTVVSCDLAAAAVLASRLDPEEFREIIGEHHRLCTEKIEALGGSVARFEGSRVIAFFGYPVAHEDDPRRAVHAALGILEACRRPGTLSKPADSASAGIRIGVETGLVVVDEAGGLGSIQALGEAPGAAVRLEQRARSGELLLGTRTQLLTRDYFAAEPAGAEGDDDGPGGAAYRVVGKTAISSRFDAAARRGLTPYTGRSAELGLIESALAEAVAGRGRVVDVSGEPGAGKSRLLVEFKATIDRDATQVLEGRCPSFGSEASYQPFVDLLSDLLGLAGAESEQLVEYVVAGVVDIDPALERYLPYYLRLLSIDSDRYALPPRFMGEEKRRAYEEALAALLTALSRTRPLVLFLEDWHWADEASASALRYLVGAIAAFPILLVVTHRPEHALGVAGVGHYLPLSLRSLGPADSEAMLRACLGARSLPDGLGSVIGERTDGNPLFIEEVCNALLADGTLEVEDGDAILTRPVHEIALPPTVQAVIRSRLDMLDPAAQNVLRLASVVGPRFERAVLERLHGASDELDPILAGLVAQDLLQQVRLVPEIEYAFKHVLTQVVVYDTLLLARRQELHARAGSAIEELGADRFVQQADALARHFDLGCVWDKAACYHIRAGVRAFDHHAIRSALRHFERADEILAEHAPAIGSHELFDLAFFKGAALGDRGRWPAAYEAISAADRIAEEEDLLDLRRRALFARANAAFWAHRFGDSLRLAEVLEALVGDDLDARVGVVATQALTSFMNERLPESLAKERELAGLLARAPDSPYASRAAFVLGVFLRWRGESRAATAYLRRAVELDRERAGIGVYLQSLLHYCLALGELGRYQEAIDLLVEGRRYGDRADSLYGVLKIDNTLGWLYQELFDYAEASRYNELSLLSTSEARGTDTSTLSEIDSFARLNLGDLHLAMGQTGEALAYFESTYAHVADDKYALARTRWKARCLIGLADAAAGAGDVQAAERSLAELDAHGFTDAFPFKKLQVRALRVRARMLAARGEHGDAEAVLAQALERAREIENPAELWKTQSVIGDLLTAAGQAERARRAHRAAADVVEGMAAALSDRSRESFLSSPPVCELLARSRGEEPRRARTS